MRPCVCACVCACVCMCVHVCVHVCVNVLLSYRRAHTHACMYTYSYVGAAAAKDVEFSLQGDHLVEGALAWPALRARRLHEAGPRAGFV